MRHLILSIACLAELAIAQPATAQKITILHTNDTHSIVDPYFSNNLGGALRRMALIDSVRHTDPNVLLVDAGDAVQGSLYFTIGHGEAEAEIMNYMDYDIQILGNHEFDNGIEALDNYVSSIDASLLATNYDFSATQLADNFEPYTVIESGGRRIGFFAINVQPEGLIDGPKIKGVRHLDPVEAANAMSWYLRNVKHVDAVIAITHIGYDDDLQLARSTRGIDAIIGGHSHTIVSPADRSAWHTVNLDGDTVAVVQTGKYGANLGELTIDFDADTIGYKLIPVDSRLDGLQDEELAGIIAPYKHKVDSISAIVIGKATDAFNTTPAMLNWMADFVHRDAARLGVGKPQLAIVNTGGIRSNLPKGNISKGNIMQSFPFDNYEVIVDVPGSALLSMLPPLIARESVGVSTNVAVSVNTSDPASASISINGKPLNPDDTYRVATINYLANGNDGLETLALYPVIAADSQYLYDAMIDAFISGFLKGKRQRPDNKSRHTIIR